MIQEKSGNVRIFAKYDELCDPKKLKNYSRNRNKHPASQISRLADAYKFHGIRHPIIVDKERKVIAAGHGRKLAAIRAGIKEFPVVYQSFESEEALYTFCQADNASTLESELDLAGINLDLAEIGPFDINSLLIPDFEIEPADKYKTDPDEVPEVDKKNVKTKLGDLYELGNHRLVCGSSLEKDVMARLMVGQKAEITLTSPPYNIGRSRGGSIFHIKYQNYSDDLSDSEYESLLTDFLENTMSFSKYQFINLQFLDCNRIATINWLFKFKNKLKEIMIWYKKHGGITPDYVLHSAYENIYVFESEDVKNRAIRLNNPLKGTTNVLERDQNMVQDEKHKAAFPVYLPRNIIKSFGVKSVIEPFCGTGTTVIACEETGAKCFAIELGPHYCDVIVSRWCKFTGQNKIKLNGEDIEWAGE